MSVYLTGARRCAQCRRHARVSNAFANGIGWRELCDHCADAPVMLVQARPVPAVPALAVIAQ